jgi:hypothetical protein
MVFRYDPEKNIFYESQKLDEQDELFTCEINGKFLDLHEISMSDEFFLLHLVNE